MGKASGIRSKQNVERRLQLVLVPLLLLLARSSVATVEAVVRVPHGRPDSPSSSSSVPGLAPTLTSPKQQHGNVSEQTDSWPQGQQQGGLWIDGELWAEHVRVGAGLRGYLVVPVLSAGLGNRLRLMASALQLAQDSGRVCVLVWQRSVSCNASFSDLFLPFPAHQHSQEGAERPAWWGLKVVEGEEARRRRGLLAAMTRWYLDHDDDYDCASPSWLQYESRGHGQGSSPLLQVPVLGLDRNLVPESWSSLLLDASHPVVLLRAKTGLYFKQAGQPCSDYYHRKAGFYRSLRPVAAVSSVLEALSARHGLGQEGAGGLVVGVHVRQVVLSHDTPEVEFAGGRHYWNESAPAGLFFDLMDAITTLHQQQPSPQPDRSSSSSGLRAFLVVSNDPSVRTALQQRFAESSPLVLTVEGMLDEEGSAAARRLLGGETDRESPRGMQRALLDWLLLARCGAVVHPFASSFGEEAAGMHGRASLQLLFQHLLQGVQALAGSAHCHNLRFLTEHRMLHDPSLGEEQARAIDVQPCPPHAHGPGPFSGLQVLCMVDEEEVDEEEVEEAGAA